MGSSLETLASLPEADAGPSSCRSWLPGTYNHITGSGRTQNPSSRDHLISGVSAGQLDLPSTCGCGVRKQGRGQGHNGDSHAKSPQGPTQPQAGSGKRLVRRAGGGRGALWCTFSTRRGWKDAGKAHVLVSSAARVGSW